MSKLEQTLNGMSTKDLKERSSKLKTQEEHYRKLRQQTNNILYKREQVELLKEIEGKGLKV